MTGCLELVRTLSSISVSRSFSVEACSITVSGVERTICSAVGRCLVLYSVGLVIMASDWTRKIWIDCFVRRSLDWKPNDVARRCTLSLDAPVIVSSWCFLRNLANIRWALCKVRFFSAVAAAATPFDGGRRSESSADALDLSNSEPLLVADSEQLHERQLPEACVDVGGRSCWVQLRKLRRTSTLLSDVARRPAKDSAPPFCIVSFSIRDASMSPQAALAAEADMTSWLWELMDG